MIYRFYLLSDISIRRWKISPQLNPGQERVRQLSIGIRAKAPNALRRNSGIVCDGDFSFLLNTSLDISSYVSQWKQPFCTSNTRRKKRQVLYSYERRQRGKFSCSLRWVLSANYRQCSFWSCSGWLKVDYTFPLIPSLIGSDQRRSLNTCMRWFRSSDNLSGL